VCQPNSIQTYINLYTILFFIYITILVGGEASTFTTRFPLCCGYCPIKVEREDGNGLRIGRLNLAPYCHIALSIFGLCFILAGGVLTGLAYNKSQETVLKQDVNKKNVIKKFISNFIYFL
jgi:hypothetical protein